MTTTTTTQSPVGELEQHFNGQLEYAKLLLRLAERSGFYLNLHIVAGGAKGQEVSQRWPVGVLDATSGLAWHIFQRSAKHNLKRPLIVNARATPIPDGAPIAPHLTKVSFDVPDRVAMRALNAPLQVLSDGFTKGYTINHSDRAVHCHKVSDRFEYVSRNAEGAQLMWKILNSPEVRHMLLRGDHYSRARSAGST